MRKTFILWTCYQNISACFLKYKNADMQNGHSKKTDQHVLPKWPLRKSWQKGGDTTRLCREEYQRLGCMVTREEQGEGLPMASRTLGLKWICIEDVGISNGTGCNRGGWMLSRRVCFPAPLICSFCPGMGPCWHRSIYLKSCFALWWIKASLVELSAIPNGFRGWKIFEWAAFKKGCMGEWLPLKAMEKG